MKIPTANAETEAKPVGSSGETTKPAGQISKGSFSEQEPACNDRVDDAAWVTSAPRVLPVLHASGRERGLR